MARFDSVGPSREGDQFHYLWAARQCLRLLDDGELAAVTIEGPSSCETSEEEIDEGFEVIDVALYFGAESLAHASLVQYFQLKHSTKSKGKAWTASGLKRTVAGFASRFSKIQDELGAGEVESSLQFTFLTNRPVASDVLETLSDLANDVEPRRPEQADLLIKYSGLTGPAVAEFFELFRVDADEPDLWSQRNLLSSDAAAYLADADFDAPAQLKELVTRKVLTDSDRTVRKHDVLHALKVSPEELFPSPSQVHRPEVEVPRRQYEEARALLAASQHPVLIHADGGVGKSMLAAHLAAPIPNGTVAILYDCFGDGLYRTALHVRHRHSDALVQISNELAAKGLCHPLIPTPYADAKQLLRAFAFRVRQAISILRGRRANASLFIIIDAADNACMAASDRGDRCFVPDLLRLPLPQGVHLALTSRSHRRELLDATPEAIEFQLKPFDEEESAQHLLRFFPSAPPDQVREFATLTSGNPRVQALALSQKSSLEDILRSLGPTPTTVSRAIGDLLSKAVARLKERDGSIEARSIDLICQCLAVLRPLVPISVLAEISGTSEGAVRSFAIDLGRPLFVKGNSLHFLDEPAETWFREQFQPDEGAMRLLLQRLRPLASHSSYAAAMLPELLLAAGRLDEVVELALSDSGLPADNPLERRDVELRRLMFALKACLGAGRYLPASKLCMRAGGELAAEARQNKLVQQNTDLAGQLLSVDRIEELVSRRTFTSSWMGSAQAYYAGLLSGRTELHAEAASRLRIALDWLRAWSRLPDDERRGERVKGADIAELAFAMLRVNGAEHVARFLRGWNSRTVAFDTGRLVGARLLDLGHVALFDTLFIAASRDPWLLLALASAADSTSHNPPSEPLQRLLRVLCDRRVVLTTDEHWNDRGGLLEAVTGAISLAIKSLPTNLHAWQHLLERYLPVDPPLGLVDRFGVQQSTLRAYSLHAAMTGRKLDPVALAHSSKRDAVREAEATGRIHDGEISTYQRDLRAVLGWFELRAERLCGRNPEDASVTISELLKNLSHAETYQQFNHKALTQVTAEQWFGTLTDSPADDLLTNRFFSWFENEKAALWPLTLISICKSAARTPGFSRFALELAPYALQRVEALENEDAESRADNFQLLARAVLPLSQAEAGAYFERAITIASRIGEENVSRWEALLNLGKAAGASPAGRPQLAYKLSRAAELTYAYVARDKHFDWEGTAKVLAMLCGPSSLAISARWRDRRFGRYSRLLPVTIEALVHRLGGLPPHTPVVLAGIDAEWNRADELVRAAEAESDVHRKRAILLAGYRYLRLLPDGLDTWQRVEELGNRLGVQLLDIDRLRRAAEQAPAGQTSSAPKELPFSASTSDRGPPEWNQVFQGISLDEPLALKAALMGCRALGTTCPTEGFLREAVARAGAGKAPGLIAAVSSWSDFGLYELRSLAKALPPSYLQLLSVKKALRTAILDACRKEPSRVFRRGYWALLPFESWNDNGIVSDADVVHSLVEGYAAKLDGMDASALFHLLDPLSSLLRSSEAAEALDYGIELLGEALEEERGDGAWRDSLHPPASTTVALAGYIWSGLGSPVGTERWEFAHAVRNAVEIGWDDFLIELVAYASMGEGGAFADRRLEFYTWHARQWLVIGLARGALTQPYLPKECINHLVRELESSHVLIRGFAAKALLACGIGDSTALSSVNSSALTPKVNAEYDEALVDETTDETPNEDDHYYFGIDIGPYWFAPLGRTFGLVENAVERRVRSVLRASFPSHGMNWKEDARHLRGIFDSHRMETQHSHGTMPKTDDAQAYRCYHAMMLVAADLLKERPPRRSREDNLDLFQEWLDGEMLSHSNGLWLVDRRDPSLVLAAPTPDHHLEPNWSWNVSVDYIDSHLATDDGLQVLWGYWSYGEASERETISVRSALAARDTAPALVAALQTASTDTFFLPSTDRGWSANEEASPLEAWVDIPSNVHSLDERDSWGASLAFPPPSPSAYAQGVAHLTASSDGRRWTARQGGTLRSESWTRVTGLGRDEAVYSGTRLAADGAFIKSLLSAFPDKCLIVSIEVERRLDEGVALREGWEPYPWDYRRIYLLDRDGIPKTL